MKLRIMHFSPTSCHFISEILTASLNKPDTNEEVSWGFTGWLDGLFTMLYSASHDKAADDRCIAENSEGMIVV
jgi:hypothetical protein